MKSFFKDKKVLIYAALILTVVCLPILGYLFPESKLGKIIQYYNQISSLIIALLTMMYVITTNRQLFAMQKQLNVMDSSVKLQIQPLPVPDVKNLTLEKIRAYVDPGTKFKKVTLLSRLHFKVDFRNAGTGAALNVMVYASLIVKSGKEKEQEIEIPDLGPNQIHLICENESEADTNSNQFMLLDNHFEIFKALKKHNRVILKMRIYYKNIFGSGFLEEAQYSLSFEDNQEDRAKLWDDFIKDGIKLVEQDIVRYESLISTLPNEADESFKKINEKLKEKFDKDIKIEQQIKPSSFKVRIVDFESSVAAEEENTRNLLKSYHPDLYQLIERS